MVGGCGLDSAGPREHVYEPSGSIEGVECLGYEYDSVPGHSAV
jgi:hypothetical protein